MEQQNALTVHIWVSALKWIPVEKTIRVLADELGVKLIVKSTKNRLLRKTICYELTGNATDLDLMTNALEQLREL